jgi:hypothetical protein
VAAAAAPQASDEMGSLLVLTSKHKLKSFAFNPAGGHKGNLGQMVLGLSNNSIEVRLGAKCFQISIVELSLTRNVGLSVVCLCPEVCIICNCHPLNLHLSVSTTQELLHVVCNMLLCYLLPHRWLMCGRAATSQPASWSCQVTAVTCAAWRSAAMTHSCSQAATQVRLL